MQQTIPTRWIQVIALWCSIAVMSALVTACGFHLRQPSPIAFKTILIKGSTQVNAALKKALAEQGVKVVAAAEDAEVQLELLKEENEQRILALSGAGVVREFELYYRVQYRTKMNNDANWGLPLIIEARRDYVFNDANLLAKQAEQKLLSESMQSDVLNGILRRLSALKQTH